MDFSMRERISDRGAALLSAATGQEFTVRTTFQSIRCALRADVNAKAENLKSFFGVASSGECRFVASLLAVMGCTALLSVEISKTAVVGDFVDGFGIDSDLQEDVWGAWLTSSL